MTVTVTSQVLLLALDHHHVSAGAPAARRVCVRVPPRLCFVSHRVSVSLHSVPVSPVSPRTPRPWLLLLLLPAASAPVGVSRVSCLAASCQRVQHFKIWPSGMPYSLHPAFRSSPGSRSRAPGPPANCCCRRFLVAMRHSPRAPAITSWALWHAHPRLICPPRPARGRYAGPSRGEHPRTCSAQDLLNSPHKVCH